MTRFTTEILVLFLISSALIYLAARNRVHALMLVVLVLALSPLVASSLALILGTIVDVFVPA